MDSSGRLWSPSPAAVREAPLTAFAGGASARAGRALAAYADLHRWSIEDRGAFWSLVWDFCGVIGERGDRTLVDGDKMPGAASSRMRGSISPRTCCGNPARRDAIVFRGEDKVERRLSLGRAAGAGVATAAGDARARRQAGRPHRRDAAEHARSHRRHARGSLARRDLVVLFARFRRPGRARPLRPDRAGAVHRLRRLLVQRQAERRDGQGAGRAGAAAERTRRRSSWTICAPPRRR